MNALIYFPWMGNSVEELKLVAVILIIFGLWIAAVKFVK